MLISGMLVTGVFCSSKHRRVLPEPLVPSIVVMSPRSSVRSEHLVLPFCPLSGRSCTKNKGRFFLPIGQPVVSEHSKGQKPGAHILSAAESRARRIWWLRFGVPGNISKISTIEAGG